MSSILTESELSLKISEQKSFIKTKEKKCENSNYLLLLSKITQNIGFGKIQILIISQTISWILGSLQNIGIDERRNLQINYYLIILWDIIKQL